MLHINHNNTKQPNPKILKVLLAEGFNLLFYGAGSKKDFVHELIQTHFSQHSFVIVNGYFQKLTTKDILHTILSELLKIDYQQKNKKKILQHIQEELKKNLNKHYFLVIHSLDFNTVKSQIINFDLIQVLNSTNFHLIVTVDKLTNTQGNYN